MIKVGRIFQWLSSSVGSVARGSVFCVFVSQSCQIHFGFTLHLQNHLSGFLSGKSSIVCPCADQSYNVLQELYLFIQIWYHFGVCQSELTFSNSTNKNLVFFFSFLLLLYLFPPSDLFLYLAYKPKIVTSQNPFKAHKGTPSHFTRFPIQVLFAFHG